jgi:hypothetical protein
MHMEWNDMNAASTPYDPVLAGRMGRMPVSVAPPRLALSFQHGCRPVQAQIVSVTDMRKEQRPEGHRHRRPRR